MGIEEELRENRVSFFLRDFVGFLKRWDFWVICFGLVWGLELFF